MVRKSNMSLLLVVLAAAVAMAGLTSSASAVPLSLPEQAPPPPPPDPVLTAAVTNLGDKVAALSKDLNALRNWSQRQATTLHTVIGYLRSRVLQLEAALATAAEAGSWKAAKQAVKKKTGVLLTAVQAWKRHKKSLQVAGPARSTPSRTTTRSRPRTRSRPTTRSRTRTRSRKKARSRR